MARSVDVRRVASQEMPVAMPDHPFCAGEMTFESPLGTDRLADRINLQNDPRYLTPISTFGIRVEQAQYLMTCS
jgi:hypothetical protein